MKCFSHIYLLFIILLFIPNNVLSWFGNSGKKVLLTDVKVLTLNSNKMTEGRRSSPVAQLECIPGGSAPCSAYKPRVVQCVNMGSDGVDVQWECKTDMDNNLRFGSIDVSCEGYDYADDPYILAGSCGLRYNLDYTKEGYQQQHNHHDYGYGGGNEHYHNDESSYSNNYYKTYGSKKSSMGFMSGIADLIVYAAIALMCWAFYKTCINPSRGNIGDTAYSTTNDDYPQGGGGGGYGWNLGGGNTGGGYNTMGAGMGPADASCGAHRRRGAGGFWTGAAAGGLLGYMLGNRGGNRTGGSWFGGTGYRGSSGWGTGGSSWGGGGGFSSSGSRSSGTRSASGFGGTSRR